MCLGRMLYRSMKVGLEGKKLEDGRPVSARTGANQTECNGENGKHACRAGMAGLVYGLRLEARKARVVFRPG